MKMLKKLSVIFLMCCLCLCLGAVTASADYDRFSSTEYYIDVEDDNWNYVEYSVSFDFEEMEARINSYYADSGTVVIPSYFDYNGRRYTVTDIIGGDCYNEYQWKVEIPSTVTYIAPESIGYYYDEVLVDNSYWDEDGFWVDDYEYVEKLVPVSGLTIACEAGTAAEKYANDNGFSTEIFRSLQDAEIIFKEKSFTYTGREIKPTLTVMLNEASLIQGTDYYVEYDSNIDAGTASLTINGNGIYRGTITKEFTIKPLDASKLTYSKVATQYYDGYSKTPEVTVKHGDRYLYWYSDYYVTYSNNTEPGTAKITFEFFGNYTGKKVVSFKIEMPAMSGVATSVTADSVTVKWDYMVCDEYRVYIYNSSTKKYDIIKKTKTNSYTHKSRKQLTAYKYAVKGVVYGESKNHTTKTVYLEVRTLPSTPTVTLATKNKAVTVKWSKNSKVDGYQIFRMTNWEYELTKVKTIKDKATTSWTNKNLSNDKDYYFVVRSYKKVDGKTIYSAYSDQIYSGSSQSRLNAATLNPKKSFKVYNVQGKETKLAWTTKLSDKDIKILKNFAKKHFTDDMSREDVLRVTLEWINRNVTYASGSLWNQIQGMSYVEAIFSAKKGQCVQYNGAMAAMMTYLGYDVQLVQGYRYSRYSGSTWQHFWVEAKIAGNTYVFETGNYGRDGSWSYLCKKYSETMGYMRNGKKVS